MADSLTIRPLTSADIPALRPVARGALDGVARALDVDPDLPPPPTPEMDVRGVARYQHVIDHDPDGAWLAVTETNEPVGTCLAIRRGGLWFLSLLVAAQGYQGAGLGRRLMDHGLRTAEGSSAGLICVSRDPRAMRRYHAAGFRLIPSYFAKGLLDRSVLPVLSNVRDGDLATDADLVEDVAIRLRGHGLGPDLAWQVEHGQAHLLIAEDAGRRGFALVHNGDVEQLAADDERLAAQLLWAGLATTPADGRAVVPWLSGAQQWGIDVAMAARLPLRLDGSLGVRGELGPFTPYLPSGIWG